MAPPDQTGLRLVEWRKAGNRRNDMRGIEFMTDDDKLSTSKAMNRITILPGQRNDVCELLCDCLWRQERQFDRPRAESPLFPSYGWESEDEEHVIRRMRSMSQTTCST